MKRFQWRPLRFEDLDALMAVMVAAFPAHYEERACFEERLALSPSWCFALEDEARSLKGYFIAYPWPLHHIPTLNTLLVSLPVQARALFINDLAVGPEVAGTGQAGAISSPSTTRRDFGGGTASRLSRATLRSPLSSPAMAMARHIWCERWKGDTPDELASLADGGLKG